MAEKSKRNKKKVGSKKKGVAEKIEKPGKIDKGESVERTDKGVELGMDQSDEVERDEEFPEDWEDYYEAGLLTKSASESKESPYKVEEKREDTRGRLAIIYTVATFLMFILGFVVAIIDAIIGNKSIIDGLATILPLISGIFLGSLGFVLGYYFRKSEGEDS